MARNAYFDSHGNRFGKMADAGASNIRSSELLPEEVFIHKEDTMFLQEALQRLSEDKREVLVLSHFHDLRYEDIAKILQCEIGTVKVRVYRALKELRKNFCELRGDRIYDV